ncbi:VOC family protein [Nocardioides sp. CER19]|uniref:VOC family protein n=1 Tax=Nocardioides sp. CER19 TaxID=3038538 RepID=UPI00244D59A2|nr:VOC family protein [Nocardioides sp. CER19]MDH2414894.1 VOC family protein [Nocardioides sp. CER19]
MGWLHAVVDVPVEHHARTAAFWAGVLGWPAGPTWAGHPELRSFEPPGGAPYLHLQEIDGPPRVHVDVASDRPEQTVRDAVRLGAVLVGEADRWQTLRSPGGLPFCVVPSGEQEPPAPTSWPDGHRSRMVQVCIDSPQAAHDREVDFWRAVLGGRWFPAAEAHEFAGKLHDDRGSPLQLLFQRLDEPDGPVRAHLDHGTDDVPAEVGRILALGAEDVRPGRGWHVLRDPAGLLFCVTENSPEQTLHRDLRDLG